MARKSRKAILDLVLVLIAEVTLVNNVTFMGLSQTSESCCDAHPMSCASEWANVPR